MIDRPARDRLIQLLERVVRNRAGLQALRGLRIDTEDETVGLIVEHLIAGAARLPLSPNDDLNRPSASGLGQVERAVAFLRGDAELKAPPMRWNHRAWAACLAVFFLGAATEIISGDRLIPPVANGLRVITAIAGSILIVRLLLAYLAALGWAAVHIFRVRVLGHRLADVAEDDAWPVDDC